MLQIPSFFNILNIAYVAILSLITNIGNLLSHCVYVDSCFCTILKLLVYPLLLLNALPILDKFIVKFVVDESVHYTGSDDVVALGYFVSHATTCH